MAEGRDTTLPADVTPIIKFYRITKVAMDADLLVDSGKFLMSPLSSPHIINMLPSCLSIQNGPGVMDAFISAQRAIWFVVQYSTLICPQCFADLHRWQNGAIPCSKERVCGRFSFTCPPCRARDDHALFRCEALRSELKFAVLLIL